MSPTSFTSFCSNSVYAIFSPSPSMSIDERPAKLTLEQRAIYRLPDGWDVSMVNVTADGAYDTRKCHERIAARNAAAVIPQRKNAKPWKPTNPGAATRNEALRSSKYHPDGTQEKDARGRL